MTALHFVKTAFAATFAVALAGCYDSRWGEQKRLQRQHASKSTPTLGVDDVAPANDKHAAKPVRVLRLRAYATRAYSAQVVDLPHAVRELLEDTNAVTEPALGARLELEGIRSWELAHDDDLEKVLAELRAIDPGKDVDRVVGLVGGLSRLTESFHELGMASLPGRHIALRAQDARQHDRIERSYSELSDDERHRIQKAHRRHRSAAVFLHEVGHTLGSPHERNDRSIMYPRYRPEMTSFGPSAILAMRAVLDRHDLTSSGNEPALYEDLGSALRQAPDGAFFEEDRRHLLDELDRIAASLARPPTATAPAPPSPEGRIADVPELTPEDRVTFARAQDLNEKADRVAAWEAGKPLFDRYPEVFAVQDLRCNIAMRVFPFEQARRECERLMKLARRLH